MNCGQTRWESPRRDRQISDEREDLVDPCLRNSSQRSAAAAQAPPAQASPYPGGTIEQQVEKMRPTGETRAYDARGGVFGRVVPRHPFDEGGPGPSRSDCV